MKTWMLAVVVMLSGGMASGAEVRLYAEDGTYLGKAGASPYDAESIDNPYGIYGSQYSANSIRNPYGKYGIQSNQIGPVVRRHVTPIPRPAESSMDGFWKGYQQGYDSTARLAQRRRERAYVPPPPQSDPAIEQHRLQQRTLAEWQVIELRGKLDRVLALCREVDEDFYQEALRLIGETRETEEEKAARLEEEGRREWEAIKAQWAAEDARKGK